MLIGGTFSRDDFTYDHTGDVYYCPAGKMLTTTGFVNDGATLRYRASKYDCKACRLKPRCCPKEPSRYVPRSIYEGARDMARQIASSWEGRTARRLRKKVEMLFAHLKRILRLDRLRLRGPNGARDEFLLAATAQNCYSACNFGSDSLLMKFRSRLALVSQRNQHHAASPASVGLGPSRV